MTQSTAEIRHVVARTGFANPLTLGVLIEDADYLKVYADLELLQVGVDYTVTGIGDANGVSVEIIGAEDVDEYVGYETFTALYDPVLQQGADLSLGGNFGRAFESALDSQNRQLQAVAERVKRSLKMSVEVGGDIVLPPPVDGWGLVWDADTEAFVWAAVNDAGALLATLPSGGADGQLLAKASGVDFDTEWIDGSFVATAIGFTPTGGLSATNVQAALAELDSEKQAADSDLTAIAELTTQTFGRARLTDEDAAAARAALLVPSFVTPEQFEAVGDGVADDTTALSNALNSGRPVCLIGSYRITSTITVALTSSKKGLSVIGGGRLLSRIILDGANVGLVVTIADVANPWGETTENVVLKDFTIVPSSTSTGAALKISGQPNAGSSEKSFYIENVDVVPDSTTTYTAIGFEFFDCRNSVMVGCNVNGRYGNYSGSGVKWHGATASAPVEFAILGCNIAHWSKGLELAPNSGGTTTGANDWQGVHVTDSTLLACDYGVYGSTVDNFSEWLSIKSCHFNVRTAGVYATDVANLFVTGCYFLFSGNAPGGTAWGVYTLINNFAGYKSQYGHITDNTVDFVTTTTAARVGIRAQTGGGAMRTFVNNNHIVGATSDVDSAATNWTRQQNAISEGLAFGDAAGVETSIENTDSTNVTTKYAGLWAYGRDTVAGRKSVGGLRVTPNDGNWVGSLLKFFGRIGDAVTELASTNAAGDLVALFGLKSSNATRGVGYSTGAGGTVTQTTNKSTGVTLSKATGQITMNNAALAANTEVTFTLTNTAIEATDILAFNHSLTAKYAVNAVCAAGSAAITIRNITGGSLSEALVLKFALIKAVTS